MPINLALLLAAGCALPATLPAPTTSAAAAPAPVEEWDAYCGRQLDAARSIGERLVRAKREKDVIAYVCTDDKLKTVEALLKVIEARLAELRCTSDEDVLRHHVAVLKVACTRIAELRAEADDCVGMDIGLF